MTRVLSDDRLAQRATKGDERALAAIYNRYHRDLYRFCLAIVGNPQDAQDALQNAMVKVLRALPGEERQIQLKPWLYRIAHNESVELLRKRHDNVEIEPELHTSGAELAETAATRERLRRLLDDLSQLPERQRAALVMRELAGLDFAQIGTAFDTSDAVARQTVYEARLSLRQMDEGREMSCASVMRELSDADGRVTRRREIKAHLRDCPGCRQFRESIAERRHDFAAIAPLPLALSAGLLHGMLGANGASAAGAAGAVTGVGTAAGGGLAGTVAVGAGKTAVSAVVLKSAAAVAVVAAVGAGAADRGGLIETPLPTSIGGAKSSESAQPESPASTVPSQAESPASTAPSQAGSESAATGATKADAKSGGPGSEANGKHKGKGSAASGKARADSAGKAPAAAHGGGKGRPENPSAASGQGKQGTSQGGKSGDHSQSGGHSRSKGHAKSKSRPPRSSHAGGRGGRHPSPPKSSSQQKQPRPPAPTQQAPTSPSAGSSTQPATSGEATSP